MYRLCVTLVATAVCAVFIAPAYADDEHENGFGRRQWSGLAQLASRIVLPGDPLHPDRCAGPAAILGGAGLTNLLGQFLASSPIASTRTGRSIRANSSSPQRTGGRSGAAITVRSCPLWRLLPISHRAVA
jgi:hypothetical protein